MDDKHRSTMRATLFLLLIALSTAPGLYASETSAVEAGAAAPAVLELVTDELEDPANVASPPDGRERIYVVDYHKGLIRVVADGRVLPRPFLDLSESIIADPDAEEGVLSLAFSPRFPGTPYVYVTYIDVDGELVLSRFEVEPSGLEAVAATEQVLLTLSRYVPQHHCGHIEFGPRDGLLYLCVGDTQSNTEVGPIAQDPDEPRGKLLRLNVEPQELVAGLAPVTEMPIPDEAQPGGYEILASGLRNPWRFGFDPVTNDLFIPDVGRRAWEEIDFLHIPVESAPNFGWPLAEGNDCLAQCDRPDLVWPIFEYPDIEGRCGVIGGAVYRGTKFPDWQGVYVFTDHCSGEIWALRHADDAPEVRKLAKTDLMPAALGTRYDGEILIADRYAHGVWRLVLPDIEGGWTSTSDAMFAMVSQARHAGLGWSKERLEIILASRAWQLLKELEPLRIAFHSLQQKIKSMF